MKKLSLTAEIPGKLNISVNLNHVKWSSYVSDDGENNCSDAEDCWQAFKDEHGRVDYFEFPYQPVYDNFCYSLSLIYFNKN